MRIVYLTMTSHLQPTVREGRRVVREERHQRVVCSRMGSLRRGNVRSMNSQSFSWGSAFVDCLMTNLFARTRLPIETPRLILRLPTSGDIPDLRRSFRDKRTARAAGALLHPPEEMTDPARMVRRTLREYRAGEHLSLSVVLRESGKCIGRVGLRGVIWNYHKVESLSFWIDPHQWNKGYATEASWFLCREAFQRLGVHRIGSSALDHNGASLAVHRKLGFVREGRER